MAKIENLAPIFIKWETGCKQKDEEAVETYYQRAKEYNRRVTGGTFVTKGDAGGLTVVGITHAAYESYLRRKGRYQGETDAHIRLITMPYKEWLEILRMSYWDKCGADGIDNQSVANLFVDFAWGSGAKTAVKKMQTLLGVKVDGVCGAKTIAALNSKDSQELFDLLMKVRTEFIDKIIKAHPSYEKFRKGWMNRITSYKYERNE